MIYIYYSHNQRLENDLLKRYMQLMPADIQDKIRKFHHKEDADACLIGRLLLLECLKNYGFGPDLLQRIKYTNYKRPYLEERVDFNISHSGTVIVCAASDKVKIGIDVERITPIELEDFKFQMTAEEWTNLMKKKNKPDEFYSFWTKKEAVIKAEGKGLGIPLKSIVLKEGYAEVDGKQWNLTELSFGSNEYKMCLASNAEDEYLLREIFF
ncbi:MAG: 4'-phosphopantetheinyl transferase superfamily protein [Sporocytophaga sp.]|nr:4'-phosphopantetheinyl transferase superfamily protein [Sporocytophaga sp.]